MYLNYVIAYIIVMLKMSFFISNWPSNISAIFVRFKIMDYTTKAARRRQQAVTKWIFIVKLSHALTPADTNEMYVVPEMCLRRRKCRPEPFLYIILILIIRSCTYRH